MADGVYEIDAVSPDTRRRLLAQLLRDGRKTPAVRATSFAQERLWFLEQLSPDTPFFNIDVALEIHSPISPAIVERCVNEIVRRHEALRTTFAAPDGRPVQVVAPTLTLTVPTVDLIDLPAADRRQRAIQLAAEEARRPFDLTTGPLLRVTLLRLDESEFVFLLTMHHIVSDGWSIEVLLDELRQLYAAFAAGAPSSLPELPIQYADYAEWQRDWLKGDALDGQLAYWRRQLAGAPTLDLPTSRPRPAFPTHEGGYQPFALSPEVTERLRAVSRAHGVTLFMTLLAAFNVLLHRYSQQSDVVVGTYVANRNRAEVERLIGFFINTLVIRTDVSGDPTFAELLRRVRETAVGAYAHQDLPFTTLVEALQPDRDLARNPLFQVVFQLVAGPQGDGRAAAESSPSSSLPIPWRRAATLDLVFSLADTGGAVAGGIEYSAELFDVATIQRMLGHFEVLIAAIADDPSRRIGGLPLLTPREEQQLLVDWNASRLTFPMEVGVVELFNRAVAAKGDAVAFIGDGEALTFADLDRRSSKLARCMSALNADRSSRIGIALPRSADAVIAMLATLKCGGTCVPLDVAYPTERLALMLNEAQPRIVISNEASIGRLPLDRTRLLRLDADDETIAACSGESIDITPSLDDVAWILYTSGSTGGPKGAALTHRQILNRLHWMWSEYPFDESDVDCHKTALNFIDSIWELLGPMLRGVTSVIVPDAVVKEPAQLVPLLARHGVTRLWIVPSLLSAVLDAWPDLGTRVPSLRFWVSSGEALRPDVVQRFQSAHPGAALYNLYGTSEVWDATWYDAGRGQTSGPRVPIGFPIANVRTRVLDAESRLVPVGIIGELHVGGAAIGPGYVSRPELTAERFVADPFCQGERLYRTGDRARYLPDGAIELIDRLDRQVKIRGHRVELNEVEDALRRVPAVRDAAVVAHTSAGGDLRLIAFVAAEPDATSDALRAQVRHVLPEFMVPARVVVLDRLPLTPSGKVDRLALREEDGMRGTQAAEPERPRTPVEVAIADLCAEVLEIEHVGLRDHFFATLGGHSLLATRLVARIRDRLGVEVPLRCIFEQPTVEGMAQAVTTLGERSTTAKPALRRVPRERRHVHITSAGVLEPSTAAHSDVSQSAEEQRNRTDTSQEARAWRSDS